MADYRVRYGQTIFDVAVQVYGAIEGVALLLEDNSGLTLNSELPVGGTLAVHGEKAIDSNRVNFLKDRGIIISNFEETERQSDEQGFWITENGDYVIDETGHKILV